MRHLSSLNLEQAITFRDEFSRFHQTIHNPTQGVDSEVGRDVAVPDVAKILSRDQSRNIRSAPSSEDGDSTHACHQRPPRARQQTWKFYNYGLTRTFFGAMVYNTKTTSSRSRFVTDDTMNDDDYSFEHEESFKLLPAGWLLRLGFNCAYNFSIHDSSTQGWQFSIGSINLVPDDALIFQYCEQGNVELVRDLLSMNLASVRDVDSYGRTALHVSHAASLYVFGNVWFYGSTNLTPVIVCRKRSVPGAMQILDRSRCGQKCADPWVHRDQLVHNPND